MLEDLPPGVPHGRLAELVTMLKPCGHAVIAAVGDAPTDLASYAQAGIRGVCLTLEPGLFGTHAMRRLRTICGTARKYNLFIFVDGVRTAEMLQAAEEAGASYLAGTMIGSDTDVPEHMHRCTETELIFRARVKAHRAP
jgi:pentose-5-phosphate-3-epimerase